MAEIKPFKGYVYNTRKIADIADVLAPPYDVISPVMQDGLYQRHEHNVVRLILGKDKIGDKGANNKYRRARDFFHEFVNKQILVRDGHPCVYIYDQEYTVEGKKKNRTGFIALIKLESPQGSKVLPHERTFMRPKKDRLKLIRQVGANLSPIFTVFDDSDSAITTLLDHETQKKPLFDVCYDEVRQRLWPVADTKIISAMQKAMRGKSIFIADGHHRYEVALAFREEMRAKSTVTGGGLPSDYVMMYFASLDEARLTILATHRAVRDIGMLTPEALMERITKYFTVSKCKNLGDMRSTQEQLRNKCAFGLYCGNHQYYVLNFQDASGVNRVIRADKSDAWKRLDVTILHNFVFKNVLKIKDTADNIMYLRGDETAVQKVDSGDCKIAFFLNPTKLEQMKTIAQLGERMPHKSTYFYPKVLSGIVINKFNS
jgi:uncharacterized protein (DUF1015 family)